MRTQLALSALFVGLASAADSVAKSIYAVDAIKAIMPNAKTTCSPTDQCRTPEQAAPFLIKSLERRTTGEIAMVLSLIGLESVDLQYKVNTRNDDQGTANMMMAPYVKEYAEFLQLPIDGKSGADILQLVIANDFYNFNSAVWFMEKHCSDDIKAKMKKGTDEGYELYLTKCIQTTVSEERQAYWKRAKEFFNLAGK
ncbi:hypothetical protein QBC32DRAFT_370409 [Pseudoneurospora amorphoporcata]|uniref:Uncharacterized protein n=1 Tax=Pseudoneurospora amorphoporcata TaxID=241081 RepID=A0AAN6NYJ0_9PEZI|nr:hypothetical protein QBC32DRAFT_370409 [Pseudoneurospora amorphoporcata]